MAIADSAEALKQLKVLVIDDEKNIRATLSVCLESMGCEVPRWPRARRALAAVAQRPFDLVVSRSAAARTSGLDLLPKLLAESPDLAVVVLTAYATIETAVEAIQARGDRLSAQTLHARADPAPGQAIHRAAASCRSWPSSTSSCKQTVPEIDLDTHSPKMRAALEIIVRCGPDRFDRFAARRKRHRQRSAGPHAALAQPRGTNIRL